MDVTFVAYGPVREVVGSKEQTLAVQEGTTVGELLSELADRHPELEDQLFEDGEVSAAVSLTVDGTNVDRLDGMETELSDGDEVRAAPPIHGG